MNKILIIEDDQPVRENISVLLSEEGFEVFEAENGKSGIEKVKEILPDLIICDILMPELDGYDVLHEIQKDSATASIPFIFLSAQSDNADIRLGMREGADDYITKPYKADDLLGAIRSRLHKKKKIDDKINELFTSISLSIPHELRTPLVAVLGYSTLLKEDINSLQKKEIAEMAEHIYSSGNDLLSLVENFLVFNELEIILASKEKLKKYSLSLLDSVTNILSIQALRTAHKYDRESDLDFALQDSSIKINKEHFSLLMEEVIDNSLKFSDKNSPIKIRSEIKNNEFIISVIDYGKGMTEEQIKKIGLLRQFEKNKINNGGIGLGLSIVKDISEIYDFDVNILSEYGKSTTVKISFPLSGTELNSKEKAA